MPFDLTKLSDDDLAAIAEAHDSGVSEQEIEAMVGGGGPAPQPAPVPVPAPAPRQKSHLHDPHLHPLDAAHMAHQDPSLKDVFMSGLALQPSPAEGGLLHPINAMTHFAGENILPIAGGIAGIPAGPAGMAAGASIARAGQHALGQGMVASGVLPGHLETGPEIAKDIGFTAGSELVGAEAAPYLGRGLKRLGGTYAKSSMGGIEKEAVERGVARTGQVFSKEASDKAATKVSSDMWKAHIEDAIKQAGDTYEAKIGEVIGKDSKYGPGFKLNLQDGVGDKAAQILEESGYGNPNLIGSPKRDASRFLEFWRKTNEMTDVSPKEFVEFQKNLNAEIANQVNAAGEMTPLGVNLLKLKHAAMDYAGEAIPEIGEANAAYRQGMSLSEMTKRLRKAKDFPGAVETAVTDHTTDLDALDRATAQVPGAQGALNAVKDSIARKGFGNEMFSAGLVPSRKMFARGAVHGTDVAARGLNRLRAAIGPMAYEAERKK